MPEEKKDQTQMVNPLDNVGQKQEDNSLVISNIVENETAGADASILGAAPEIDMSLIEDIQPPKNLLLLVLKLVFWLLIFAGLGLILFFNSQLNSSFKGANEALSIPSIIENLDKSNNELIRLKTDTNYFKYLKAKGYLDQISYFSDGFLQNYQVYKAKTSDDREVLDARDAMEKTKTEIQRLVLRARENYLIDLQIPLVDLKYSSPNALKTLFEDGLREKIGLEIQELTGESDDLKSRVEILRQTQKMVGNSELYNLLAEANLEEFDFEQTKNFLEKLNSLVENDLSKVQVVKANRIKWSDIINEIERKTSVVDKNNGQFFEKFGGIKYTSYDFDTDNRRISLVGEAKRFDTTNFTMIANLIDSLNSSELFEDANANSFSKSGSLETGYKSVLKLNLTLSDETN